MREYIAERTPFDEKETSRILNKFFQRVPKAVAVCLRDYGFDRKKVLDLGSSFGQSLLYWGPDSEGVDVQPDTDEFGQAMGRRMYHINIEVGFPSSMNASYDAVYTSNLFEHLIAPHLFLARVHAVLRPKGILAIAHPVVPAFPFRVLLERAGFCGWRAVEHVNFFTPETSKLTLEYAGFRVLRQYNLGLPNYLGLRWLLRPLSIQCLSIVEKVEKYQYHPRRDRIYDPEWARDTDHFRNIENVPARREQ